MESSLIQESMTALSFEKNNSKEDGIVLEELLKGYKFRGMLLRPSKVKVNKLELGEAKK